MRFGRKNLILMPIIFIILTTLSSCVSTTLNRPYMRTGKPLSEVAILKPNTVTERTGKNIIGQMRYYNTKIIIDKIDENSVLGNGSVDLELTPGTHAVTFHVICGWGVSQKHVNYGNYKYTRPKTLKYFFSKGNTYTIEPNISEKQTFKIAWNPRIVNITNKK